jgi:ribosomal protein S18 acetylase RimI-like enzyme
VSVFVRTAGSRDIPAIRALLAETWHATYDGFYGAGTVDELTAELHSPKALQAMIDRDRSEYLVADDGERLCGCAYAAATGDDARIVTLFQLYVLPALQGRGIGGMLLEEVEQSFFESERLRLEVEEKNTRAVAFYETEGFSQVGREEHGGALPRTLLIYEKSLV